MKDRKMKNNWRKVLLLAMVLTIFYVMPSYADTTFYWNGIEIQEYDDALQKWDESTGDWEQILRYEFEAKQEDNPDEDLTLLINAIDVENLEVGTYRARGLHAVYLGDVYEGYTSKTAGIQITK